MLADQFTDAESGARVRVRVENAGPLGLTGEQHVEVKIGDRWFTLDELNFECPCCGSEVEP